jgi:hypothetical protein
MLSRARLSILLALTLSAAAACSGGASKTAGTAAAASSAAPAATPTLDDLLRAAWQKQSITPAAPADDATFLRRASLDLLGALPPPEQVRAFTADPRPDKRSVLVDDMLKDPRFSDRFSAVWTDILLGEPGPKLGVDRAAFRSFLRARLEERAPWDSIARDIVGGEGRNSPGGALRDRAVASMSATAEPEAKGVHGAVNFPLRYRNTVEDLAGKTSRAFLGVQIQCAQCHDHKTEKWTTDQFRGFAAAFIKTRGAPAEGKEKGEMRLFDVEDRPRARLGPKAPDSARAIASVEPRALDGTKLDPDRPRKALAAWIASKDNPWFAKAFVNRVWAGLTGSGFVEPVDDLRPGNPAALPEALDLLANEFVRSGFDVRRLVRAICLSEAYQRSAGPAAELWSSFALRPLPADVLLDGIVSAAGLGPLLEDVAGERADVIRARTRQRFVLVLDVDEDAGTHRFEGSIAHALLLSNGSVARVAATAVEGSALEKIVHGPGSDDDKIAEMYLRALSRRPTSEELAHWKRFLDEASASGADSGAAPAPAPGKADPLGRLAKRLKSKARTARERAYEDIFWAMLNSSEMAFRH